MGNKRRRDSDNRLAYFEQAERRERSPVTANDAYNLDLQFREILSVTTSSKRRETGVVFSIVTVDEIYTLLLLEFCKLQIANFPKY